MKHKGPYIVLSLYSFTRWFTEFFEDNFDLFDANILYFIFDGAIICCIGLFLYANSEKDYVSKISLGLMSLMGVLQAVNFLNSYYYGRYIHYSPVIIGGITVLEVYKKKDKIKRFFKKK